ncbi:MAG: MBL fold metallo-hydrolase [Methanosarcinales archaeon]|nr:MAG: MBL fold metallo-hydrolase [Methanosarcinales archaeon]
MVNVHKITGSHGANAYLIDAEHPILVDVGAPNMSDALKKFLNPTDLEYIILTHCHYDHALGATQLAKRTGASIAIHEEDAKLLGDDCATASAIFGARAPSIEPDMLLKGGKSLDLGDISLRIIHTPGHSPGSICLYGSGLLFSGDTIFVAGGIGRTDLGGDAHALVDSIKLLTALDVDILYPGHGDITNQNVNAQIRASLKYAKINRKAYNSKGFYAFCII